MIQQTKYYLFLLLFMIASCSAQDHSPTDQLLKGPIDITTEWQTITFDKPLLAAPHVQDIRLLSCGDQYDFTKIGSDEQRYFSSPHRFRRVADQQIVEPEIIVNDGKHEYQLFHSINGSFYKKKVGGCLFIGYSMQGEGFMELILPPETTFVSMKIRANVAMTIDHLYWLAEGYERYPNASWEKRRPSQIIKMK